MHERENIIDEVFVPSNKLVGFVLSGMVGYVGKRLSSKYPPGSIQKTSLVKLSQALQKWAASGFQT